MDFYFKIAASCCIVFLSLTAVFGLIGIPYKTDWRDYATRSFAVLAVISVVALVLVLIWA